MRNLSLLPRDVGSSFVTQNGEIQHVCGAPIARLVTQIPNQVSRDTLRANDKWPNGICVTDLAIWGRSEKEQTC